MRGEKGPKRDIVLMNAAVALIVSGRTDDLRTAFSMAAESIDTGSALKKFEEVKRVSNAI